MTVFEAQFGHLVALLLSYTILFFLVGQKAVNEARVDTGSGRGTGSLAMAFDEPFDQKASTSAGVITLGIDQGGSGAASKQSTGEGMYSDTFAVSACIVI